MTGQSLLTHEEKVERIRRRMKRIRGHLDGDVEGIIANAEQLMDWRYYIKRYPWVSMGAAAVVGYSLIPRAAPPPLQPVYLDKEAARELAAQNEKFVVKQPGNGTNAFVKSLVMLAANTIVRSAVSNFGQQVMNGYANSQAVAAQRANAESFTRQS